MCDLSKWAIHITHKRILQIERTKPFEILSLRNYDRHKLAADGRARRDEYLNFILANPEYLPDKARDMTVKFTDYIDYWAVDWDYPADGRDIFHNRWQSFRPRRTPKLHTKATHTYQPPGAYKVLIKVLDIFANDTSKLLEVNVK